MNITFHATRTTRQDLWLRSICRDVADHTNDSATAMRLISAELAKIKRGKTQRHITDAYRLIPGKNGTLEAWHLNCHYNPDRLVCTLSPSEKQYVNPLDHV
jgi:hypothetical protein